MLFVARLDWFALMKFENEGSCFVEMQLVLTCMVAMVYPYAFCFETDRLKFSACSPRGRPLLCPRLKLLLNLTALCPFDKSLAFILNSKLFQYAGVLGFWGESIGRALPYIFNFTITRTSIAILAISIITFFIIINNRISTCQTAFRVS